MLFVCNGVFAAFAAKQEQGKQHKEVSLRMIGHQVLLYLGDSTSRVLPVTTEGIKHTIRFESDFSFHPEDVAVVIDSVIEATGLAKNYVVAFVKCGTDEVVHSYEVNQVPESSVLACRERGQPTGCYDLVLTIMDPVAEVPAEVGQANSGRSFFMGVEIGNLLMILVGVVILLSAIIVFLVRRNAAAEGDPNVVILGSYRFNRINMELTFEDQRIELTSKEADLLSLLCSSANNTVERDDILKVVWGDEGDYVGRTLDVFISKLRKKLESDSNVKIVNVRGVGYRLVLSE